MMASVVGDARTRKEGFASRAKRKTQNETKNEDKDTEQIKEATSVTRVDLNVVCGSSSDQDCAMVVLVPSLKKHTLE